MLIINKEFYDISATEADYNFYVQLLIGDGSDDIPGFDGKFRQKLPKFAQKMLFEMEDFEREIFDVYDSKKQFLLNYNLVKIWTKENDFWIPDIIQNLLGQSPLEPKQEVKLESLLSTSCLINQ